MPKNEASATLGTAVSYFRTRFSANDLEAWLEREPDAKILLLSRQKVSDLVDTYYDEIEARQRD